MKSSKIFILLVAAALIAFFLYLMNSLEHSPYARCRAAGGIPPQCLYYDFVEITEYNITGEK